MSRGYIVPILHQQDGAMTLQAFAEREGLTPGQVKRCIRAGKVLGARQDARSKHWTIYPPAKLMERPRSNAKRQGVLPLCSAPAVEPAAPPLAAHPTEARAGARSGVVLAGMGIPEGGRCATTAARSAEGIHPPASQQAPQGRAVPQVYTEARSVCRALHAAALKQFREGLHYLRLDAHEFAQLYAALDNDRSRIRKLVGRGLLPVGLLRASDSVWQKLQAMSREGRLL